MDILKSAIEEEVWRNVPCEENAINSSAGLHLLSIVETPCDCDDGKHRTMLAVAYNAVKICNHTVSANIWHLKFVAVLSIKITAFWDLTSCILVDTFVRSVVTQLHVVASQKTAIICYHTVGSYAYFVFILSWLRQLTSCNLNGSS